MLDGLEPFIFYVTVQKLFTKVVYKWTPIYKWMMQGLPCKGVTPFQETSKYNSLRMSLILCRCKWQWIWSRRTYSALPPCHDIFVGGDMRWQLAEADVFSKKRPPTNQRDCLGRSRGQPFAPEISWVSIRASEFARYPSDTPTHPDTHVYIYIDIYCIYMYIYCIYISKYIKIILNMTSNILNIL